MSTATTPRVHLLGTCALIVGLVHATSFAEEPVAATDSQSQIAEAASPAAAEQFAQAGELQNAGKLEEATRAWAKFIKQHGDDPLRIDADHCLGTCLLQQQKYESAAKQFACVLEKSDNDQLREEALVSLAWCHYSLGVAENLKEDQLRQAASYFKRHTEEYPQSDTVDESHFFVGECLSLLQQFEEAEAAYRIVIDQHPKSKHLASALVSAAYVNKSSGRYREAITYHERLVHEFPDQAEQADIKLNFADTLAAIHQLAGAESLFAELAHDPDLPTLEYVLFRRASCLEQLERFAEAGDVYTTLIERFPTSDAVGSASLAAGRSYLLAGRTDAAQRNLHLALQHDGPHTAGARHWMCQTLLAGGQAAAAVQWARETLSVPDLSSIEQLRAKLDLAEASAAAQGDPDAVFAKFDALLAEEGIVSTSAGPPESGPTNQQIDARKALIIRTAIRAAIAAQADDHIAKYGRQLLSQLGGHPQAASIERLIIDDLLREGDFEAVAERLAGMVQRYPGHAESELWQLELAAIHYRVGDFAAAIDVAKPLAESPSSLELVDATEVWCILGAASSQLGDSVNAIAAFEHSVVETSRPEIRAKMLIQLAEVHRRLDNLDAARDALQRVLQDENLSKAREMEQPGSLALVGLAGIQGDRETAFRMLEELGSEASAPQPTPQTDALKRAWLAVRNEDFDAAEADFTRLIESSSDDIANPAEAYYGRAVVLKKLDRPAKSLEDLRAYFDLPARVFDEDALLLMAECELAVQQWEAADVTLRRLIADFPESQQIDQALSRLTVALVRTGRFPEALEAIERLEKDSPDSRWLGPAWRYLADGQFEAGQFREAAETYLKVVSAASTPAETETARYRRGWALFQNREFEVAAGVFDNQYQQFPQGRLADRAKFMQAESLFKLGEFDQARKHYEQLVSRASLDAELAAIALLHGSECYRRSNEHQRAATWLRRIATDHPSSVYVPKSVFELGRVYLQLGDDERAIAQFITATKPGKTEIAGRSHFSLGEVYASQRKFANALREFQTVMYGFEERDGENLSRLAPWRARAGIEAARCSGQLAKQARSARQRQSYREQVEKSLRFVIDRFPNTREAAVAQRALERLRVAQEVPTSAR